MPLLIAAFLLTALLATKPVGRRFLAGHHLDGKRRSDGTFLHRGRNALDISGHVSPWALLAGWERATWRLAAVLGPVVFILGLQLDALITAAATATVGAAAAAHPTMRGVRAAKTQRHHWHVTKPLAQTLTPAVGQATGIHHRDWIDCPPNYRQTGVTIQLPATFPGTEDQQQRVAAIAAGKLGGEWEPTYTMQGATPTLTLQHSPEPPALVGWNDIRPHLEIADEAQPILGLGSGGRDAVALDFDGDTPHVLVSVPSGGGKSLAARLIASQILHYGGQLLILDYKKISHTWADGLPGVTYARSPEEIHAALLGLQQEIARRYEAATGELEPSSLSNETGPPQAETGIARRLLVIVEELNATADILQAHWQNHRPRGVNLQRSPAVMALQAALYTGRQALVNVCALSQKGTANAFGGSSGAAARENTTPIIGGNRSANTWAMLAPDITPPLRSTHPGRMHVVTGDHARAVQVAYLSDQQARLWATTGTAPPQPVEDEADDLSALGFGLA